jgi:hypothetical protein
MKGKVALVTYISDSLISVAGGKAAELYVPGM